MRIIYVLIIYLTISNPAICQENSKYLIKAGKLFDSESKVFLKDQFVFIEDDKITKVTEADRSPHPDYEIIDLSNSTVTPGLIDSHTHLLLRQKSGTSLIEDLIENSDHDRLLRATNSAKSFLHAGITTVKDLGNSGHYLDLTLRDAIEKGWVDGPRMFISGPAISSSLGQFGRLPHLHSHLTEKEYSIIRTVEEGRISVIEHKNKRVDIIKIIADSGWQRFTFDQLKAIVETAHAHNLKVTAHANYDEIVWLAVKAGVDGIEHGYSISDTTLQLMAENGTYLVPTDNSYDGYKRLVEFSGNDYYTDEMLRQHVTGVQDRLIRAFNAGVTIVNGRDGYMYTPRPIGISAKNSIVSYLEAGLSVTDVLQISTYNGALAIGKQNEIGVIKNGAYADIIAFDGDLEKDFMDLIYDKVHFVMKGGIIYKGN